MFSIMTWNVNSIRARIDHVATYLADHEPDIVCLQETKVEDKIFPRVPFMELGYTVTLHGSRALAGVATMTKVEPTEVHKGFREGKPDQHCRILNTVVDGVRVYNLYVPNGTGVGTEAYKYKLSWLGRLRQELDDHYENTEEIVIVGDFNIAPTDLDVWDPEYFQGRLQFTDEEHAALSELKDFGLTDCFRKHESAGEHYTWYDYRTGGFGRNQGMRIDHVYATEPLAERSTRVVHDDTPRGWDVPSDHVPVTAYFD